MVTQSLVAHADCVSVIAMAIWVKLPLVREKCCKGDDEDVPV